MPSPLNGTQPAEYFGDLLAHAPVQLLAPELPEPGREFLARLLDRPGIDVHAFALTEARRELLKLEPGQPHPGPVAVALQAAVLRFVGEIPDRVHVARHRKHRLRVPVPDAQLQCLYGFHGRKNS
jgi:hypothetical protein